METASWMPVSSSRPSLLLGKAYNCRSLDRFFPKKVELQALIKFYDVDGDGNVSYEEFVRGLR